MGLRHAAEAEEGMVLQGPSLLVNSGKLIGAKRQGWCFGLVQH
jgi:hypothetical protein